MNDNFQWNVSEYFRSKDKSLFSWSTDKKTIMYCLSCGHMLFINQGCFHYSEEVPPSIDTKITILKDVIENHVDSDYIIFSNICKNCAQKMLNDNICDEVKDKIDICEFESGKKTRYV